VIAHVNGDRACEPITDREWKIAEQGTHAELLKMHGHYRLYTQHQARIGSNMVDEALGVKVKKKGAVWRQIDDPKPHPPCRLLGRHPNFE
jgi:hypothetical protein